MRIRSRLFRPLLAALLLGLNGAIASAAPLFVPLLKTDFPDAFVLPAGDVFYAYATNSGSTNVQLASSRDLVNWAIVKDPAKPGHSLDAMPQLPPWAKRGNTWAPEVLKVGSTYILYFTARDKKSGYQCVGAATSGDARGPFTSSATEPLVCQKKLGGTIDASPFRDSDGQLYLYYKNDGNNPKAAKPVQIWGQRLAPDGLSLTGDPVALLRTDAPWEGFLIEAPTMVRSGTGYTLFYSANDFAWQDSQRLSAYAIGYSSCSGPMGPCTDAEANPLLHSFNDPKAGCLSGPGHQSVFEVAGKTFLTFHAWQTTPGCRRLDWKRFVYIAPLLWKNGVPALGIGLRPPGE